MIRRAATVLLASTALLSAALPAQSRERPLFAIQQLGAVGITTFSVDLDTGVLTQQPGVVSLGMPTVPGISADGSHLFVADYNADTVNSFTTDPTGAVAVPGGSVASGDGSNAVIASPTGSFAWTADYNGNSASGVSITGGVPTALPGFPMATGNAPTTLAVSPRHNFVFQPANLGNELIGMTRGGDGSLTPLAGSPFAQPGAPIDVEFTPDGTRLYSVNNSGGNLSGFTVDQSTGNLTALAGSPWPAGTNPIAVAITPDGGHMLVANNTGGLTSYALGSGGTPTPVDSASTGSTPNDVTITPDGRFVYVANFWSGTISGYAIDANGSLTELSGSPFGDASGAVASFAIVPNQGPQASFTTSVSGSAATLDASASTDSDGAPANYHWDFGDGNSADTAAPTTVHNYSRPGTYNVALTVTDDEGCATQQIGTGQTLYCNGSPAASVQHQLTIAPPTPAKLVLSKVSGKQAKNRRSGRKITRRVRTRFTLSEKANVTYRFQRSLQGGTCRRGARTAARHTIRFRNFGRSMTRPARAGSNQRTFARSLGGRRIKPGRYRFQLSARASDGRQTATITTKSFCVR